MDLHGLLLILQEDKREAAKAIEGGYSKKKLHDELHKHLLLLYLLGSSF